MNQETNGKPGRPAGSARAARRAMEARVALLAAGGLTEINRRLLELSPRPRSRRKLEVEEWCALKALRGDFNGLPALATAEGRSKEAAAEGEGQGSRPDREAVRGALRAARGGP